MLSNVRITENEMKYIALLENMTGATVLDCIIDEEADTVIFAVKKGDIGLVVGRGGEKIRRFRKLINKNVEVFEYIENPEKFIRNALKPARVKDLRLVDKVNGGKIAMVNVETKDKGIAIGKNGQNIKRIRLMAKRYFNLENIIIN
ncbi:MAG: NusA-like transcription termination signal-binding factor [Candidatus Bathyarchaeia archaeon]|nr:NusA-like transcription termination signal-binding factor [Candidatus Bathyarchaeota archaeon]